MIRPTRRPMIAAALAVAVTAAGCGSRRTPQLDGRGIFVSAGCGSCHTLTPAHTHGTSGPDFDTSELLSRGQIRKQLDVGVGGMPSFRGRLTPREEDAVADFLFQAMQRRR